MVLTNFELWAADGSSALNMPLELESSAHTRHLNPFDPRAVPSQINSNITHLSSNGYYGFSYVNAAHIDIEDSNNNINNNNNNISTYNLMGNDVNGMNITTMTATPQTHAVSANNIDSAAHAAGNAANVTRCKKRFFVMNDADDCTANNKNHNGCDVTAKRCRFDDDFAAQYCNDFFSLPSTQIATQSCLMDTEEVMHTQPQQQYFPIQQQVDEAMFANNNNNNNNNEKYEQNLHLQLQHEQHEQSQMQTTTAQLTPPSTQHQQMAQSPHQQQRYQGHLHRSNRDVSRCMLSHMI